MYGCMCSFEITIRLKQKYLSKTLYIHNSYASALIKNTVSIKEWIAATKETKKHYTLKKTVPYD